MKKLFSKISRKKKSKEEVFVAWVKEFICKLQKPLHLTEYKIFVAREPFSQEGNVMFEIRQSYPYKQAHISWNKQAMREYENGKGEVEAMLLHELLHIHTNSLAHIARERFITESALRDAEEHITDIFTSILEPFL